MILSVLRHATAILLAALVVVSAGCDDKSAERAHRQRMAEIQADLDMKRARLEAEVQKAKDWNDTARKIAEGFVGLVGFAAFLAGIGFTVCGLRVLGGRFAERRRVLEARREAFVKAMDTADRVAATLAPHQRAALIRDIAKAANQPDLLDVDPVLRLPGGAR